MTRSPRVRIAASLLLLWLVWGSTYLAVTCVLPALPPLVLSGARFAVAGPAMVAAAALTAPRPPTRELLAAGAVGLFLFLGGNGGTVSAQAYLSSGLTAVLVGLVPLWLVILGLFAERDVPHPRRIAGVTTGLIGVAGLVGGLGGAHLDPMGVAFVVGATLSWATGSLFARRWVLPRSLAWSTAAQMCAGSVGLIAAAVVSGQTTAIHLEHLDGLAVACFLWLVGAGSLAAVVAYNYLLRTTAPAIAATYAYVNPLVAVWLGWWLGGEQLSASQLGWSLVIVTAIVLVTSTPARLPSRA